MKKSIKVALAGNPNVGKTTVLNKLAGTALKVGNWPGVTVEKKEAFVKVKDYTLHFVDLPGIYTLDPISEDEKIAVNFIKNEKPDVILNIVDTPNLERNLLLTTELLEFGIPLILVLNMTDEAERIGMDIDSDRIEELLKVKVVKTVGRTGKGIDKIIPLLVEIYEKGKTPNSVNYSPAFEEALREVSKRYPKANKHLKIELLSKSQEFKSLKEELEKKFGKSIQEIVADERYAFAHGLYSEVLKRSGSVSRDITDTIDKLVLHPFAGFLVFIGVVYLTFKIAFDFSSPFVDWIDSFINDFLSPLSYNFLETLPLPVWFQRFFSEAVIGGVGFVLTFTPLIGSLYFLITFLEMSGYIPRVAFLMDRFMHKLGVHGRSVIPLILGFGCNVPAIIATRTMESTRDKILVTVMIPFMSCPARLVVFAFFISLFFKDNPAIILTFLYILGIFIALITAFVLRKTLYRGVLSHFVMELPPYRLPSIKSVFTITWAHLKDFLYRAGTLIFGASLLIWLLLNSPPGVKNPSESIAALIGKSLVPVFEPIGISDWRATTSLIPAFLAREIALSSMGTIYTATEDIQRKEDFKIVEASVEQLKAFAEATFEAVRSIFTLKITTFEVEEEEDSLREILREKFNPASALSFMIFILLYTSCLGTFAVMMREIGRIKAFLFLIYSFFIAWLTSFVVYRFYLFLVSI